MPLSSQLFRGDAKLEAAAVSDPSHITQGAKGPHVGKIQQALITLDGATLAVDQSYGPATAGAVRAYKQKRKIFGPGQSSADSIVGKLTMAMLDSEMLAKERNQPPNPLPPLPPNPLPPPPRIVGAFFGIRCPNELEGHDIQSNDPPDFFEIIDIINKRVALYRFDFPQSLGIEEVASFPPPFRKFSTNQFLGVEDFNFPTNYTTILTLDEDGRESFQSFMEINLLPASAFPSRARMGIHANLKLKVQTRPSTTEISRAGRLKFVRALSFPPRNMVIR